MPHKHYSQNDIERFWRVLKAYKTALETGTKRDIIYTSLAIHQASGDVPRNMRALVNKTYRETERKTPLEE